MANIRPEEDAAGVKTSCEMDASADRQADPAIALSAGVMLAIRRRTPLLIK